MTEGGFWKVRYDAQHKTLHDCKDALAEARAERDRYREGLVRMYRMGDKTSAPLAVARVCDEFIDRSGALLGEIRREARR